MYLGIIKKVGSVIEDYEHPNGIHDGFEKDIIFYTLPCIGKQFISPFSFQTSTVVEILEQSDNFVSFKTNNSYYTLTFKIKNNGIN